jgi:hypothetical protein
MLLEEPGKVVVYAATGSARHAKHCPACPSGPAAKGLAGKKDTCSWQCPTNTGCACPRRANCSEPSEWSCHPTSNCQFWVNTSADLTTWAQDNHTRFPPSNDTNCDRVWWDKGNWWAFTAGRIGGYPHTDGAQENFYGNAGALHGAGAEWVALPRPFLTNNASVVIAGHPQRSEFVSADYFQHLPGAPPDTECGVFLFHTYDGRSSVNASAYNYGVFASGSQPAGAGTPFVPTLFRAFDYSCFVPDDSAVDGLGIASSHGVTQFGCCAKTGAGPDVGGGQKRRVLFGWQQNGNSGGDHLGTDPRAWSNSSENTMTLPRDLSWGPDGIILQRFVRQVFRPLKLIDLGLLRTVRQI